MAAFTVKNIIDGNTIEVTPNWKWGDSEGNLVKIVGYTIPDLNYGTFAKNKLITLLTNKPIDLKNALSVIGSDKIYCSVYLNDIDVSQYFPEMKQA